MANNKNKVMNENINLVEILKDAPRGTKLWSPLCGEYEFIDESTLKSGIIDYSDCTTTDF